MLSALKTGAIMPRVTVLFMLTTLAISLSAHDLEIDVRESAFAVTTRASYGGHDAAAFARIEIYSPSDEETPYQTGQTDRNGYFSFVPEESGNWVVWIDDGTGHRQETTVSVDPTQDAPAMQSTGSPPQWQPLVTGLSLILGIAGLLYGLKNRTSRAA